MRGTGAAQRAALGLVILAVASACSAPAPPATRPAPATLMPVAEPTPSVAPSGSRVEVGTFRSAALARVMPLAVYLPPGYETSATRRYPVVYLLHGLGGVYDEWMVYGIPQTADRLIASGEITPLIIVFPQGDQAYWVDHSNGGPRWGEYTARDVVREIDARYRTIADRRSRAVGGLSMGADGALQLSLNFPHTFGVTGAHSPVLRRFPDRPSYFGDEREYAKRDPWTLALAHPDVARSLTLWIDVGSEDPVRTRIVAFHEALAAAGIAHAWREFPGSHSDEYWTKHGPDYLRFYAASLCAESRTAGPCPLPARH